jgi:hypothetical protein
MDFKSCRSTWVTQATGSDPVCLNISGDYPYRCQISYIPEKVLDHGGAGSYVCEVPFEVGQRKLASLDLLKELPLLGLPQFRSGCSRHPSVRMESTRVSGKQQDLMRKLGPLPIWLSPKTNTVFGSEIPRPISFRSRLRRKEEKWVSVSAEF